MDGWMDDWAIIRFSLSQLRLPSLCSVETVEAFLFTRFTSLTYIASPNLEPKPTLGADGWMDVPDKKGA